MPHPASSPGRVPRSALFWTLILVGALGAFAANHASGAGEPSAGVPAQTHILLHVLLALCVVIAAGQLLGRVFALLQQPPVIGEVVAGIMLGPSLLGTVAPGVYEQLLPEKVGPYLNIIAQLGIVLYMFIVGLELDLSVLRDRAKATLLIALASMVVPFVMGAGLAVGIFESLAPTNVAFVPFALFMGAAMSVTAFPVLARILTDRRISKTELGIVVLASAAIGDVAAWCLLAFVVGVAQAKVENAIWITTLAIAYVGAMLVLGRALLHRLAPQAESGLSKPILALVFAGLFASAWLTEWIGIHAIFGAFFFGACIPHDSRLARDLPHRLEDFVTVVLLPAFFAFTGMRTQIGLISGLEDWLWCGAIIVIATLGKFSGSAIMARICGMGWRDASAVGVLMNTRGLMELIVLTIGLDLGVISPRLFAMMVIMALVTTIATTPLLWLIGVRSPEDG